MASAANRGPIGKKLGEFVRQQLLQAEGLLARAGEKRHKGVHEARKCMRRVRSVVAMLDKKNAKAASRLDQDLGELCRSLSSLRDAQALNEALSRLAKARSEPNPETAPELHDKELLERALVCAAAIRTEALEQELLRDPDLANRRAQLQVFVAESAALPWLEMTEQDLNEALDDSEKRLEKAAIRAKKDLKDHDRWHCYRKRVRRLRQQHGILEKIAPKLLAHGLNDVKRSEAKATELGESQDDALLLQFCKKPSAFDKELRRWIRAIAKARLKQTRHVHAEQTVE
jgi:CHAD domain-containing protein